VESGENGSDRTQPDEQRRLFIRLAVAALAVIAGVTTFGVLAGGRPVSPGPGTYDPGTTDPVRAAVPVLAGFVERTRELRFDRLPVVSVVDAPAFEAARAEAGRVSDDRRPADRDATARALGLAATGGTPGAWLPDRAVYSPSKGQLYLRAGQPLDAVTRLALVHELTLALHDQHFGLRRLAAAAAGNADRERALAALVGGDASRVEQVYLAGLPPADQQAVRRQRGTTEPATFAAYAARFADTAGAEFVDALLRAGGNKAVDAAFGRPPMSTAQILDPQKYLSGVEPVGVRPPPADGEPVDSGTFGEFGLAMLVTQGRRLVNVSAASQWAGDRYVTFRSGSGFCTSVNLVLADGDARDQLAGDLAGWLRARGGRAQAVASSGRGLRIRSCSPR
jgi:hypothetical protein